MRRLLSDSHGELERAQIAAISVGLLLGFLILLGCLRRAGPRKVSPSS